MDIMELGAIGELVGGVAVIATLIYLAVQIRQGNQAGSREAYRAWVSDMNRGLFEPQLDPEFNEVFHKANRDWDSVSPRDQARVNAVYSHVMLLFQEGFAQRARGHGDEYLAGQLDATATTMLQMPGMATWWKRASFLFSERFRAHIERLLTSNSGIPPLQEAFPWYVGEPSAPAGREA